MFEIAGTALLSAVLLAAPPPEARAAASKDSAVAAVADAYRAATLKGDAAEIMRLYADDAVEMPPGAPLAKGRAAIEQFYRQQMGGPGKITAFTLEHLESRTAGDVGYDVGTYRQTMTGGPMAGEDIGKYVVILKRSGGQWKVAYAIYNSDRNPPAAGAPAPR